jgi:hypothetical protein
MRRGSPHPHEHPFVAPTPHALPPIGNAPRLLPRQGKGPHPRASAPFTPQKGVPANGQPTKPTNLFGRHRQVATRLIHLPPIAASYNQYTSYHSNSHSLIANHQQPTAGPISSREEAQRSDLISSFPHFLIFSFPHFLISSFPHFLISHPLPQTIFAPASNSLIFCHFPSIKEQQLAP